MVRKGASCDDCRNNKPTSLSPNVTRFFKIMFGKDFSEVLYLPPKFARTVRHLADQETQLEDSSGHRWSVTCSYVDRSLALHKGWNKFFVDHGLKKGHLLLFHYINGSHFNVQIFGENACERTNFDYVVPRHNKRSRSSPDPVSADELFQTININSRENECERTSLDYVGPRRSKRLRPNPDPVSPDEPFQTIDENSREKPSSADSVASQSEFRNYEKHQPLANTNIATPCLMISVDMDDPICERRDDGCYKGEDRSILYDLSCFEMERKKPEIQTNEINGHSNDVEKFEEALGTKLGSSSRTYNTERSKVQGDDPKMAMNGKSTVESCAEKFDKALDNKVASSQTVEMKQTKTAVIHANQKRNFIDKFEKASDVKLAHSHTAKTEQSKTKVDGTQKAEIHLEKINGYSGVSLTDKFHFKTSDNSNLSKKVHVDISFSSKDSGSLSRGHSKIVEREYAVKHKCPDSSVSSSLLKYPLGQHAVKSEQVELNDEGKDAEENPMIVTERGVVFLPEVKVEPDLPYDIVSSDAFSPFLAEVKSLLYLELPKQIPGRKERGRGKVVYLRDPRGRLWPMIYHDLFSAKVLIGNWSRFCQQNGIKPGDECRFQVENLKLCFYRVDVDRREGEHLK